MPQAVIPSTSRPISSEVLKGAIANAGLGDWVVPTSEDHYATHLGLSGAPLNAFDQSSASDSMTVTIQTGEAYVGGAWLGIDVTTDVTLDASTDNQEIAVGPQYQTSDGIRIDLVQNFAAEEDYHVIWELWTDSAGVTDFEDRRSLGGAGEVARLDDDEIVTGAWSIQNAATVNTENLLLNRDGYGINFGSGGQNDERPFIAPYVNGSSKFSREITWNDSADRWEIEGGLHVPDSPISDQRGTTVASGQERVIYVRQNAPDSSDGSTHDIWLEY